MTFSFEFDLDDKTKKKLEDVAFTHDSEPQEEGTYYKLSDGNTYHEKDVIVGKDNIRDHQINKII